MLQFRVMNDYDTIINPSKNGFISKKLIYEEAKRYLYQIEKEKMNSLSLKEKDEYIKEYMTEYLLNHRYKIDKLFRKEYLKTRNRINNFIEEKDIISYCEIMKDLSTLPTHLITGTKNITNWISTTSNFDCIWKYYDRQSIHEVAVLDINTNGITDNNTYVVDLSNREIINKANYIINKIDDEDYSKIISIMKNNPELQNSMIEEFNSFLIKPTSKKFRGFNYSTSSSEYCIYNHIKKESIKMILESLEIDLICASLFDTDYLFLSNSKKKEELKKLKDMILSHIIQENNSYMLYVFEELYLKKHNISEISNSKKEEEKITLTRNEILSKSKNLPSRLIKSK